MKLFEGLKDKTKRLREYLNFMPIAIAIVMLNEIDTRSLGKIISEEKKQFLFIYMNAIIQHVIISLGMLLKREMPEQEMAYRDELLLMILLSEPFIAKLMMKLFPDIFICAGNYSKRFRENIDGTSTIKWRRITLTQHIQIKKEEWEYYGDVKTFWKCICSSYLI